MFNNKYPYRSSMSKTMTVSFKNLSKLINKKFKPNKILEIGSNDGSFIKNFSKKKKLLVLNHVQMLKKLLEKWVLIHIQNIGIPKQQNNY